jgi:hypothetical protein
VSLRPFYVCFITYVHALATEEQNEKPRYFSYIKWKNNIKITIIYIQKSEYAYIYIKEMRGKKKRMGYFIILSSMFLLKLIINNTTLFHSFFFIAYKLSNKFVNENVIFIENKKKYKINKVYSHVCENVMSNKKRRTWRGM